MALYDDINDNILYVGTFDGRFTIRTNKETFEKATEEDNIRERTNKLGNVVYETHHGCLDGILYDIKLEGGDYGLQWLIDLEDNGKLQRLCLGTGGGVSSIFLNRLPNVDFSRKIKLSIYRFKATADKPEHDGLTLSQKDPETNKDIPVARYWTIDGEHQLPPLIHNELKNTYDDTNRLKFLQEYVEKEIRPKLKAATQEEAMPEGAVDEDEDKPTTEPKTDIKFLSGDDPDDLPF